MRIILGALALLLSLNSFASAPLPLEQCIHHAPFGFPTTNKTSVTSICRTGYFTIHDNRAKIPLVTSYVLRPEHAAGCSERDNSFSPDLSLPKEFRAETKDYAKSGYDIGHMANAADLKWSDEAQASAALLTNATPQLPEFNRGIWKKLESFTRGWAISRNSNILIYVGPIYNQSKDKTIGKNFVGVPNSFYKVLIDTKTNETMVFIFDHKGSKESLSTFISSLPELQKRTGIVFKMPKPVKYTSLWPVQIKEVSKFKACSLK